MSAEQHITKTFKHMLGCYSSSQSVPRVELHHDSGLRYAYANAATLLTAVTSLSMSWPSVLQATELLASD